MNEWRYPSERDLAEAALEQLGHYFTVEREVGGVHCSGKRMRLDAVLQPRDPVGWADKAPVFGVEFKNALAASFDTRKFTAWAAQAIDYTHTDWDKYGRLKIFTCPAVSTPFTDRTVYGEGAGRLMVRVLGQLGVGELGPTERGWTLKINGDNLWSERRGVERRWSLIPKSGSR